MTLLLPISSSSNAGMRCWARFVDKSQRTEAEAGQSALEEIGSGITILPSLPILRQAFVLALDLAEPIYDCIYLAAAIATDRKLITADMRFAAKVRRSRFAENRITPLHLLPPWAVPGSPACLSPRGRSDYVIVSFMP
jgi:predicted nucleic acid-binding protein